MTDRDKELVAKIAHEIADMQELVEDKDATFEMKANARSYIRGMKKAINIITENEDEIQSR